jgi:hypothetical protein
MEDAGDIKNSLFQSPTGRNLALFNKGERRIARTSDYKSKSIEFARRQRIPQTYQRIFGRLISCGPDHLSRSKDDIINLPDCRTETEEEKLLEKHSVADYRKDLQESDDTFVTPDPITGRALHPGTIIGTRGLIHPRFFASPGAEPQRNLLAPDHCARKNTDTDGDDRSS